MELLIKVFGIQLVDWKDLFELIIRFSLNLILILTLVRFIYYRKNKKKEYLFTFILFNLVIFFVCNMLANVKLSMGFAFGLFAVFSILRYRTGTIPIKEMTYLFISITIGVINALANKKTSYAELLFTDAAILGLTYILEYVWLVVNETSKEILYENIEYVKEENREKLIIDLNERTGLNIHRVEIGKIDFLRDVAQLNVFYYESGDEPNKNMTEPH